MRHSLNRRGGVRKRHPQRVYRPGYGIGTPGDVASVDGGLIFGAGRLTARS
jgi:hypothetical protein